MKKKRVQNRRERVGTTTDSFHHVEEDKIEPRTASSMRFTSPSECFRMAHDHALFFTGEADTSNGKGLSQRRQRTGPAATFDQQKNYGLPIALSGNTIIKSNDQ